jgi:deoxyadenosine/deoxycytidine kinase
MSDRGRGVRGRFPPTPCHFTSLDELSERVLGFQRESRKTATPSDWTFTRADLDALLDRLDQRGRPAPAA